MGRGCTSQVKEHSASVLDTREISARMAYAAFKKAEISLKQAQKKVPHHVWGATLETAGEGTLSLTEVKKKEV